jgi:hypothetical protein
MSTIRPLIYEGEKDHKTGNTIPINRDYSDATLNPDYANSVAKTLDGDRKAMVL